MLVIKSLGKRFQLPAAIAAAMLLAAAFASPATGHRVVGANDASQFEHARPASIHQGQSEPIEQADEDDQGEQADENDQGDQADENEPADQADEDDQGEQADENEPADQADEDDQGEQADENEPADQADAGGSDANSSSDD